ncbi:TylF/MycF/NovP-related O-methyltransferase [Lutibacter sp.]|uniref:TylF/MycF/NovP-related O-methyltransferase n=1 Tax=Lutibacter sp. TaxID=1925666 RepID=UPI001A207812|nr:TylF/MycF/NovP-related O-methyltransferase [Lutibacter sp.]MBI9042009.1 hypothetical protein [Lutibacter sp.]
MKNKIKKIIVRVIKYFGYKLVPISSASSNFKKLDSTALNENFDNICHNYENLFGEKYGKIPKNEKRIGILKDLLGTPPSEAYFIINSIAKTEMIDGDVCEFGVAQGITSQLIANEILNNELKKLHLFDSFEGLPKPTTNDTLKDDIFNLGSIEAYAGKMSLPIELVLNRLDNIEFPKNRYVIHKGFIEELIIAKRQFPKYVSFAYVDFDFYEPIKIILEYLNNVTKKGAVIMVDDYDFFSTGVKIAVDEFILENKSKYELFIPKKTFGCFAILTKLED